MESFALALVRLPQQLLLGLVKGYRLLLKPWLGNACRFEPTCSAYALDALQRHGAAKGAWLAGGRLLRCHPWCDGGFNPAPEKWTTPGAGLFSRLGLMSSDDSSAKHNSP
ncbi:MAG: membrane protein insertion efficiency factor YidD [Rubrivivax sp.]|nr:membrane protein insertion efficiency factor YidD [Rubrivivax sp.]MDP3085455.1 membrane protein insertion efficiency factor YidD [Rubrivivax sp.]